MTERVLIARMDNLGDVLLAGPCVRAVAASASSVVMLVGPRGRAAADLLPGVDEVVEWRAPWIDPEPDPVTPELIDDLVERIRALDVDRALILTSFHQSPLPLAMALRLAGVPWIGAISDDYPGSLLDLRHRVSGDPPEALRALSLTAAAGYRLPPGDTRHPRIRRPLPDVSRWTGEPGYVVVHPAASVPARQASVAMSATIVASLAEDGHRVVVTGGPEDADLTAIASCGGGHTGTHTVSGTAVTDLGGNTSLAELAAVLDGAAVVVAPNTAAAHLATAVGTPVVSLFAPVVPAGRWAPYGSPCVLLGDQSAPCRDSRARSCPAPGHPCLESLDPHQVVSAVARLEPRTEDQHREEVDRNDQRIAG